MNDIETTWQQLIDAITALETKLSHDERDQVAMKQAIAKLHLVQPFDWMHLVRQLPRWFKYPR